MRGGSLVIFDWDDTLFPTSALADGGHLKPSKDGSAPSKPFPAEELAACSAAALRVLAESRKFGNRLIVTNADHGWVHDSAARFMPSLAGELKDIPVISARSIFEPQGIVDAKMRKVMCFWRVVQCFHSGPQGIWGLQNLISIGDSLEEQEATIKIAQHCPCYVKSVKLADRPSMRQLAQQLDLLVFTDQLAEIFYHVGNLDLELGQVGADDEAEEDDAKENEIPPSQSTPNRESQAEEDCEPVNKKRRLPSWPDRFAPSLGA
jgi:hypothetical protein